MTEVGFPTFKNKPAGTFLNWAPKLTNLAKVVAKFLLDLEWGTYTPTVYGYGTLGFTTTTQIFNYFKLGKTIFIQGKVYGTTTGTADAALAFKLPIPVEGDYRLAVFHTHLYMGSAGEVGYAYADSDLETIFIRRYNDANWTVGANREFAISGFYRVK